MPLTQTQSNTIGAALAAVLIGGALVGGYAVFSPASTQTHVVVEWPDGGPPEGVLCTWFTGLLQQADGGASKYGYAHACGTLVDGGRDAPLPANLLAFTAPDVTEAYDGGPRLEVWSADDANAPFPCACSTGSSCQVLTPATDGGTDGFGVGPGVLVPAPLGVTLQPGWVGAGCKRKSCVELAGTSSWPTESCPLQ